MPILTHTFSHGVHPPETKITAGEPIRRLPFAPVLLIPLNQHIGAPARPTVREGVEVRRGQKIAEPGGFVSIPYHAPASGAVQRIGWMPTSTGRMTRGIYLNPFPATVQQVVKGEGIDPERATAEQIADAVRDCGMVGLGGAGFPSHVKFRVPEGKKIDTLIVNGAECEPYLTADHRIMLERGEDIFAGIRYVLKAVGASAPAPDAVVSDLSHPFASGHTTGPFAVRLARATTDGEGRAEG